MKVYNFAKAQRILGISSPTMRDLLREGKIRSARAGVRWLISDESIREFLRGGSGESGKSPEPPQAA